MDSRGSGSAALAGRVRPILPNDILWADVAVKPQATQNTLEVDFYNRCMNSTLIRVGCVSQRPKIMAQRRTVSARQHGPSYPQITLLTLPALQITDYPKGFGVRLNFGLLVKSYFSLNLAGTYARVSLGEVNPAR